tara:strand:- start:1682 stop:4168 length:2487 start_codon:yes stop_codon:yes gene_type:complete
MKRGKNMRFYTSVNSVGNEIFVKGFNNGKRFTEKVPYQPAMFMKCNAGEKTKYRDIYGTPLKKIQFDSLLEAKDKCFQKTTRDDYYGMANFEYSFISDEWPEDIQFDPNVVKKLYLDIEVSSENGFPKPEEASEPVTAITVSDGKKYFVFGLKEYKPHKKDIYYRRCNSEHELLDYFIKFWAGFDTDIITGWNTKFFDIPYLVNRIKLLLGEKSAKRLSPINVVRPRTAHKLNKAEQIYNIIGVSDLDYLEMYKKFTFTNQESYRLDHIAFIELGEKKLDYSEYEGLFDLYEKDYQKFIEYNVKDVELIVRLEEKLGFIEMVQTMAYDAKVNYDDTFFQVRMWDVIIFNALRKHKIVVPPKLRRHSESFEGAYVKEPKVGYYEWVTSFDLNSLYPHIIMQWNTSPETLKRKNSDVTVNDLLNGTCTPQITEQESMMANGSVYDNTRTGILPALMSKMYQDRKIYKKEMIKLQKEYEKTKDHNTKMLADKYYNLQLVKKIQLNSAYGAIGNKYFRFFDIRIAEGITTSGQLVIRWAEKKMNEFLRKRFGNDEKDFVIASDTDSLYLDLSDYVNEMDTKDKTEIADGLNIVSQNEIQPYMEGFYDELKNYLNCPKQKMVMEREVIADQGIWVGKKHYVLNVLDSEGVRYDEPKLKMMGISAVKSSTPAICRDKIKKSINILMNGNQEELFDFLNAAREDFMKAAPEDIMFPRGVNNIKKYSGEETLYTKGTPIHVKGALLFNKFLTEKNLGKKYEKIEEGEKIKFCYLKQPNPVFDTVFAVKNVLPKEFGLEEFIDYEKQWEKAFLESVGDIVDARGWKMKKSSSLFDFF